MQEKQINIVLKVLEYGPAHSRDISDETGLSVKTVSSYLSELFKCGLISEFGEIRLSKRGNPSKIWKLVK